MWEEEVDMEMDEEMKEREEGWKDSLEVAGEAGDDQYHPGGGAVQALIDPKHSLGSDH